MSAPVARRDEPYYTPLRITDAPTAAPQIRRFEIQHDGYFEVNRLLAQDDARNLNKPGSGYGLLISEQNGPAWSNDFVQSDLMFCPAANPARLLTPIILPASQILNVAFKTTGLTPVYNRFDAALLGVKRPFMSDATYRLARQRPYFMYVTPFNRDFSGTTGADLDILIDRDGAFVVQSLCFVGGYNLTPGTDYDELGALRVQIRNMSRGGDPYFERPMGVFQVFGQKDIWQGPNRVLSPMIFGRNEVIRVEVTVDSTEATLSATWKNIQFGFEGFKVKG